MTPKPLNQLTEPLYTLRTAARLAWFVRTHGAPLRAGRIAEMVADAGRQLRRQKERAK